MTTRKGLFWPLVLIAIGGIALLANFGYINRLSMLSLLSLWPLVLILIGIDIAFGRRWPVPTLVADVLIIALGLALVTTQPSFPGGLFFIQTQPGDSTISVPRNDSKTQRLRLSGGAGSFDVHGGALPEELAHVTSERGDLRLRQNVRTGERADVRVEQSGFGDGFHFGPTQSGRVDATIANDVPTSLILDAGAGTFTFDLRDVNTTDATVNVGAADLRIVLPKPTGDVSFVVSAGASNIVIEVPSGVEAKVTVSGGLLSTHYDSTRIPTGETSGYANAKDRVTVKISAGASSITVR